MTARKLFNYGLEKFCSLCTTEEPLIELENYRLNGVGKEKKEMCHSVLRNMLTI